MKTSAWGCGRLKSAQAYVIAPTIAAHWRTVAALFSVSIRGIQLSTNTVDSPVISQLAPASDVPVPNRDRIHRRISWGAVLGAVVIVIAVQILLSLLGAGIGLGTVGVNEGSTPNGATLGIGAGLWWIISSFAALLAGGYIAGWLAGVEMRIDGALHGLIAWGIATLAGLWLLSSTLGGLADGGMSALRGMSGAAGRGLSDAAVPMAQAAGVTPDSLSQMAQDYLQPTDQSPGTLTPQQAKSDVASNLAVYARGGPEADAARTRIVGITAAQLNISEPAAEARFDQAQVKLKQARDSAIQSAKDAADTTASVASKTAFAAFGVMLLGAIAAALGGSMSTQPPQWNRTVKTARPV